MDDTLIKQCGDELYNALRKAESIQPLTERFSSLSIKDAYHISLKLLERRQADGESVVGKKIGVTSRAVQEMLGVDQPDFGFLTDAMAFTNGSAISLSENRLIQPRAEGELAFILKKPLKGPGITPEQVIDATEFVMPCFEIVDSRIDNWRIKIQDTVADNASCGAYVLGEGHCSPDALALDQLEMTVFKNGEAISRGKGSAVQGHPARAVAWLANTLGELGIPFEAGEVILSGSLVPLEPVGAGDEMRLEVPGLGSASVSFS